MPTPPPFEFDASASAELHQARTLVRQNRLSDAEQAFRQILESEPLQTEALRFLANAALSRGDFGESVALLSRAAAANRDDVGVLLELGAAYGRCDRRDEARHTFRHALDVTHGRSTTARLMLASIFEQDDRADMALLHYFRAIIEAQGQGQWRSDDTTEPGLRRLVRHALDYVARGRRALFDASLQPYRNTHGKELARIDAALAGYLLESRFAPDDPRQRASFLYLPGLGTTMPLAAEQVAGLVAFTDQLGEHQSAIRACFAQPDPAAASAPAPFSLAGLSAPATTSPTQSRSVAIIQRGNITPANRTRFVGLLADLDTVALMRVGGYGANVRLYELPAGANMAVEYGSSNAICKAFVACPDSAPAQILIGGDRHLLAPGKVLVCDPSFGVGLGNASDHTAYVLALDVWHPNLALFEQAALTALIGAVLRFDAQLQDLDQPAG